MGDRKGELCGSIRGLLWGIVLGKCREGYWDYILGPSLEGSRQESNYFITL